MTPISVALCTYNGERFLEKQLTSLTVQSRVPSELVVCDDGSSDNTLSIIERFARTAPYPVRVHRNQDNLGSTKNFEQAIRLCTGSLIALCDQDDIWLPGKLMSLSSLLSRCPSAVAAFSDADLIDSNDDRLGRRLSDVYGMPSVQDECIPRQELVRALIHRPFISGATLMIRAAAREFCLPMSNLWVHDAWMSWMFALYGKLAVVNEPLVLYRIHEGQQIGLRNRIKRGPARLLTEISRARAQGRKPYAMLAEALTDVREHCAAKPAENCDAILKVIDGKVAFLARRVALPSGFGARTWKILSMLSDYAQYDNGILGAVRDMLAPA